MQPKNKISTIKNLTILMVSIALNFNNTQDKKYNARKIKIIIMNDTKLKTWQAII